MMNYTLMHKIIDLRLKQSRNNGRRGRGHQVVASGIPLLTVYMIGNS